MYRMAILAMCTTDTSLDVPKYVHVTLMICNPCPCTSIYIRCVMMAIVHDLAEAQGRHNNEEWEPVCLYLPCSRRYPTAGRHIKGRKTEIGRSMYDSNLLYHRTVSSVTGSNAQFRTRHATFQPPGTTDICLVEGPPFGFLFCAELDVACHVGNTKKAKLPRQNSSKVMTDARRQLSIAQNII